MMSPSRRHLPSTAGLTALEALARLESVTGAAQELNLTQSAVSRQLQALEAQLGVALFVRARKRVSLTPAGQRYAQEVRRALDVLNNAALRLQTNPEGGALNLAILPTFGMRWLMPRLPRFSRLHPDVTINMSTRLKPFDFSSEGFDAALHYGAADWPDTHTMLLEEETVLPVAAPGYLAERQVSQAEELLKHPLLHIQTRPEAWSDWFTSLSVPHHGLAGTRYDQFSTILQAARHGLGVALIPEYLAHEEIAEGRLAVALDAPVKSRGAYYLIWPKERGKAPALTAFRSWLADELAGEDNLPR